MIPEAVEKHYLERWGKPSRTAEFRRGDRRIEVYKWAAGATSEGVTLYATVGASRYPMVGMPDGHRVEFFIGLNPERDDIASPLAGLALYGHEEHVAIGHGHTVPVGKPLWRGSEMSTFLVLRPVMEIVPAIHLTDGMHVEFLQAIPVFPSEVAYKSQHKAEDLLERWRAARVPFWDPNRRPEPAGVTQAD